jgi:hypothetical protein
MSQTQPKFWIARVNPANASPNAGYGLYISVCVPKDKPESRCPKINSIVPVNVSEHSEWDNEGKTNRSGAAQNRQLIT